MKRPVFIPYTIFLWALLIVMAEAAFAARSVSGADVSSPEPEGRSVIIYPDHFAEAAAAFASLHTRYGGLEAILIPLSRIKQSQHASHLKIPFHGYGTHNLEKPHIRNFDYDLAKKIIAYLRDFRTRVDIKAVLLLGDGALVPPSYYFYAPYLNDLKVPDKNYNEWIASDILYASPDFDLALEWAVGRISVDTNEQALKVAGKYEKWHQDTVDSGPHHPFIFFAGNIRKDLVYSGELFYLLLQQQMIVGGEDKHYFESDGRFTIHHLEDSFRKEPARIHYIFSHGSGDGFEIEGDYLYSHQIAAMPYKQGLPLVVSSSCLDGGFDYDLIDVPHDRDGYSIGEAILRADGAGIGYLGSSRVSLGQFHYSIKDGNIDPEFMYYRYMPGLLMDFFDAYHDGFQSIGDAYVEAHRRYKERFDTIDSKDFATFVEINLLADPIMRLPLVEKRKIAFEHLVLLSEHNAEKRIPLVPLHKPIIFGLHENSPHQSVTVSVVDVKKGHKIGHARVQLDKHLVFKLDYAGSFLMRIEFEDGTVSWQYFQSG